MAKHTGVKANTQTCGQHEKDVYLDGETNYKNKSTNHMGTSSRIGKQGRWGIRAYLAQEEADNQESDQVNNEKGTKQWASKYELWG